MLLHVMTTVLEFLQYKASALACNARALTRAHIAILTCTYVHSPPTARACAHAGETNMTILVDGTIDENRKDYTQGWNGFKEQASDFIQWAVGNRTEVIIRSG